jgi:hypothetical protein
VELLVFTPRDLSARDFGGGPLRDNASLNKMIVDQTALGVSGCRKTSDR